MWFFEIGIVIIQSLGDSEPAFLIEFPADLVDYVHVQVYGLYIGIFPNILLQHGHHLAPNSPFPVGFKHSEGEYICMLAFFVHFHSDCIGTDDDIVVEGEF